ncbi:SPFH domain-containing protein [Nannocystis sp. RBIL2]|uniref:flotillin family protein n=1 Tax=Nannocystis sp. RBIL2 TaxID=2996788 RepID=UPI00226EEF2C|nr:flotillin family protein [Nannocystis sp. RBIL2]MCY1066034.1 SPFH domain-containing protein [Nannocystis sp. RBIL2]
MESTFEALTQNVAGLAIVGALSIGLGVLLLLMLVKNFLYLCHPNEALIFTGRKRVKDGVDLGPLVILGRGVVGQAPEYHGCGKGRAWRIPVLEVIDRLDMSAMSIDVYVQNAYSSGNIPLKIHAIANVKISPDPRLIRNAIERFLGRSSQEIQQVARQTLEGALREVLAQMTPEAVNHDRLEFANNLAKSAQDDLDKLGLQLDTLKIQHVADETGYLDSLGRPQIAAVLRDAEKAESQAQQEISEAQAQANQRAEVAKAAAETAILVKRNELAKIRAELEGRASAVEREAEAAAKTARAAAEQELQTVRSELEQKRLMAEVIIPAEVDRAARLLLAKGDAAPTIENGAAVAEVLRLTSEAWQTMGPQAREIYVIQHLEELLSAVLAPIQNLKVREVAALDPGDGSALASYAASYPRAVASVLSALRETTGVDVPAILAGKTGAQ